MFFSLQAFIYPHICRSAIYISFAISLSVSIYTRDNVYLITLLSPRPCLSLWEVMPTLIRHVTILIVRLSLNNGVSSACFYVFICLSLCLLICIHLALSVCLCIFCVSPFVRLTVQFLLWVSLSFFLPFYFSLCSFRFFTFVLFNWNFSLSLLFFTFRISCNLSVIFCPCMSLCFLPLLHLLHSLFPSFLYVSIFAFKSVRFCLAAFPFSFAFLLND